METAAQSQSRESKDGKPRPIAGGIRLEYRDDLVQALAGAAHALGQVRGAAHHVTHLAGVSRMFALWNGIWTLENGGIYQSPLEILESPLV
ncbi:MAG TPA: hypothetical protein VKA68_03670, partial [bacterium]|nr:hypothetical protein [bacterium]